MSTSSLTCWACSSGQTLDRVEVEVEESGLRAFSPVVFAVLQSLCRCYWMCQIIILYQSRSVCQAHNLDREECRERERDRAARVIRSSPSAIPVCLVHLIARQASGPVRHRLVAVVIHLHGRLAVSSREAARPLSRLVSSRIALGGGRLAARFPRCHERSRGPSNRSRKVRSSLTASHWSRMVRPAVAPFPPSRSSYPADWLSDSGSH